MVVAVGTGRAVCGLAAGGGVAIGFSVGTAVVEEGVAGVGAEGVALGAGAPGPPCTRGA